MNDGGISAGGTSAMKNVLLFILLTTTVVAGYIAATSRLRLSVDQLKGKTEVLVRGDLTIPINATGEIKPMLRVEIKSEASGEVVTIARRPGERVKAGDLLIRLQRDDEQRSVNRTKLEVKAAEARLREAEFQYQQIQTSDLQSAQAQVDQVDANLVLAVFKLEKLTRLPEHQRNSEELLQRQTAVAVQQAQLDGARAGLERAKLAVPLAEQRVRQAEAAYESAQQTLGDAEKRLSKTDIVSPIGGVVADIRTQIGEVIQGGKSTLTGGTVLAVVFDIDTLLVRAEVDESDIGRVLEIAPAWAIPGRPDDAEVPDDLFAVAKGMDQLPVITVESFRDEEFLGIVERIYPEPKNLSGVVTYLVDVVITSDNRTSLLPGMRADVRFTSEHVENVVLCPNEAIRQGKGGKLGVYIPKPGAPAEEHATVFVPCLFGLDDGNSSQVMDGMEDGATVYTKLPSKSGRNKKKERGK